MKQKDILFLLISTFIVVVAWIGSNLYHKWVTSTISADLQIQIKPIAPDFDQATVDKIRARKHVAPLYQLKSIEPTSSPAPTTQPTPTSSPSFPTGEPPSTLEPTSTQSQSIPTEQQTETEEIPIEEQ